jgi:hypothetical protein
MKFTGIDSDDRPIFGMDIADLEGVLAPQHNIVIEFIPICNGGKF